MACILDNEDDGGAGTETSVCHSSILAHRRGRVNSGKIENKRISREGP